MKRISISILIALVAFVATAAITRSWGQSQLESYLGANGWTLKQNIILIPNGEKPRVIGREEFLFFADGRRKNTIYNYKDGKEYIAFTEVLIPKVGALHENFRSRHLDFIADYQGFGGDVDVSQAKNSPEYAGDEQVLGYNCAVKRTFLPDGAVVESYDGYNFAAFPLNRVSRNQERVQISRVWTNEGGRLTSLRGATSDRLVVCKYKKAPRRKV